MKLPLVVYSLILCALWLYRVISPSGRSQGLFWSIFPAWALMSSAALLSISFGKPGLTPQYAAWLVVVASLLRIVSKSSPRCDKILEVVSLLAIAYLWLNQLPFSLLG